MKTVPGVIGTFKNESSTTKHENWTQCSRYRPRRVQEHKLGKPDPAPSILPKTDSGAQNMKMGPDAIDTAQVVYGSANQENCNQHPRYRGK
jgi:hypothetical protein